jgi:hypothetical protein
MLGANGSTAANRCDKLGSMVRLLIFVAITAGTVSAAPTARLGKAELRPALKAIARLVERCYTRELARDPQASGVINTQLAVRNEPDGAMRFTVTGFVTAGRLGTSREFLACVKTTFESATPRPVATRGSIEITYPMTFGTLPVDNRDKAIVDTARRAADAGRWRDALAAAERGLESTTLDGTFRRPLIAIAGVAACHLNERAKAHYYITLASPEHEAEIERACAP